MPYAIQESTVQLAVAAKSTFKAEPVPTFNYGQLEW